MKPVVRPAIASDFEKFLDIPLPYRVRAWTGLIGDEVVACGGIAYFPDDTHGGFFLCDEKAREYPVALHKAAVAVLKEAKRAGIKRLVTVADPEVPAAERWLIRLGFKPTDGTHNSEKVWVCSLSD